MVGSFLSFSWWLVLHLWSWHEGLSSCDVKVASAGGSDGSLVDTFLRPHCRSCSLGLRYLKAFGVPPSL